MDGRVMVQPIQKRPAIETGLPRGRLLQLGAAAIGRLTTLSRLPIASAAERWCQAYSSMRFFVPLLLLAFSLDAAAADVIAHRALSCSAIENSSSAVAASWSIGVDAVELDVRISKDGVAYTFHDDKIEKVPLADLEFENIQRRAGTIAAPTLLSALESDRGRGYYILDLKDVSDNQLQDLIDAIKTSRIEQNRFTFQSERIATLSELRRHIPDGRFFFLSRLRRVPPLFVSPKPEDLLSRLALHGLDGVSIKGRRFIDRRFVEVLKSGGLQVYVWTINDLTRADYYRDIGVDGIITDLAGEMLLKFDRGARPVSMCESETTQKRSRLRTRNS